MEQRVWIWSQALAFVLVLTGVSLVLADDADSVPAYTDKFDDGTFNNKNCREYATQCRTEQVNKCLVLVQGDQGCSGCSFIASGFKLHDLRRLGFCATPAPLEKVNGCSIENPSAQCAILKCYEKITVTGGVAACDENGSICYGMIIWLGDFDVEQFCLYAQ